MGAIASGGVVVWNEQLLSSLHVSEDRRAAVVARERGELERRERAYRGHRPPIAVRDRTMLVIDDGLATGATMHAAVAALRSESPKAIVVAVPVAPLAAFEALSPHVEEVVVLMLPERFGAVGEWYEDFRATTDEEVVALLRG